MITQPTRENIKALDEIFFNWVLNVTNMSILKGAGSPEGFIPARSTRLYMDTTGTSENILYIKRDDSIAGDRTMGWILV